MLLPQNSALLCGIWQGGKSRLRIRPRVHIVSVASYLVDWSKHNIVADAIQILTSLAKAHFPNLKLKNVIRMIRLEHGKRVMQMLMLDELIKPPEDTVSRVLSIIGREVRPGD